MFKAKLQTRAGGAAAIAADDERSARGQGRDGSGQQAQARKRTRKQRPRHILPQIRSSLGVLVLQWLIWYYPCAKSGGASLIERLRLDRVPGIVRKAEMVAHLMHQPMGDERVQAFPAFSPRPEERRVGTECERK